jgi:predicted flap endonuclease-1-like 5' DNA nuclease
MPMLIFETFLLMLGSALLGAALGHLLWEAYGGPGGDTDRPWLRDLGSIPPVPLLPAAPALLAPAERARLTALAAAPAAPSASASPLAVAAASAVAEPVAPSAPIPAEAAAPVEMPPPAGPAIAADAAERAAAADAVGARPVGLLAADASLHASVDGKPDDLELIKGIGPVNAKRLHELGIWHFAQIAAWTPENVAWVGSFLAFPGRIEREHWVDQAKAFLPPKQ